jgi:hypothetical protein
VGKFLWKRILFFFLDSKRDRRKVTGACGQLADRCGSGRPVFAGWPGRLCCRGRLRLAAFRFLSKAGRYIRVSNFLIFFFSICLTGIYFLLNLNEIF